MPETGYLKAACVAEDLQLVHNHPGVFYNGLVAEGAQVSVSQCAGGEKEGGGELISYQ